ncbi:folylpolyglutamate synthase/dihydrofolate synthase family protein [Lentimicrobium sp.]|uniref:bifunctional folylpolyglutamate synthase/dihydrofolate synthase n=1 Tax=Lentimicrobium sp. TaxID=2034841 RepID=UPI002C1A77BD|nr:folylpolyglutamate synthase/dihydrofolate synthase family protein [Lentimicrobium sp.]HPR25028.1 folylpolyglutamate synthase/dihydrofolate synthase family protein [Lentimicrobium sp.]
MNYQQTLDYMFSRLPMFQRIGAAAYKANLDNTLALCELTGHPYRKFRSIHVAGTNGKGSVSHMLASIMQENGLKTGLFTSPHLKDFRERIKVNGEMVTREFVTGFIEKYKRDFEKISPSFFEMTFAMAMCWFEEMQVDIAIIETGMGGRLDSTNVITPILSIITNVGYDHTQFLGKTLEEIAAEKAGIIKSEVPVVIGETLPGSADVFREIAFQKNAPIVFADKVVKVVRDGRHPVAGEMMVTAFHSLRKSIFKSPLTGNYQLKNIATVIAAADLLQTTYALFADLTVTAGIHNTIKNTGLAGRWQVLKEKPLTICDIGHNPDGISEIVHQLNSMDFNQLHFVLGVVNDKDIDKMLSLLPMNARYYFCKADIPRGLDANELHEKALGFELFGESYPSVRAAYHAAVSNATDNDLVFIGGSAFVVAEVI